MITTHGYIRHNLNGKDPQALVPRGRERRFAVFRVIELVSRATPKSV